MDSRIKEMQDNTEIIIKFIIVQWVHREHMPRRSVYIFLGVSKLKAFSC